MGSLGKCLISSRTETSKKNKFAAQSRAWQAQIRAKIIFSVLLLLGLQSNLLVLSALVYEWLVYVGLFTIYGLILIWLTVIANKFGKGVLTIVFYIISVLGFSMWLPVLIIWAFVVSFESRINYFNIVWYLAFLY